MIRLREVKIKVEEKGLDTIRRKIAHKMKISPSRIKKFEILKKSIDARNVQCIYYVYELGVCLFKEEEFLRCHSEYSKVENSRYTYNSIGTKEMIYRPIIVGSGPAGLFCAYMLASYGYKPLIIERGKRVEERVLDVESFWKDNILNSESNIQFGEGGAGTFSDGKLNTMVRKSLYHQKVLEIFLENGAPKDILTSSTPHIGTDLLRKVIINIRKNLIKMGGEIRYSSKLTNIIEINKEINEIEINGLEKLKTNILVLAIGHSARDTFKMLSKKLNMESKPFAIGLRIQHSQKFIDQTLYGDKFKLLPHANYKLTYKGNNRGIYSFCMCPGGYVVDASSEANHLCVNGMSNQARDAKNANSAIVVTVSKNDYGDNLFDGVDFQRRLEAKAFELGKGLIPVSLYGDYKNNKTSTEFKSIDPVFKGKVSFANLNNLFSTEINVEIKNAIEHFNKIIPGFNNPDAILAGVESRTSSPIRILRDTNYESNIKGIYPCGEGAGYAGGITSAAIDGIKVFEAIANTYKSM